MRFLGILTADHSHTMSINGCAAQQFESGHSRRSDDKKPYPTLSCTNRPGAKAELRANLSGVDTTAVDFLQQALVPIGVAVSRNSILTRRPPDSGSMRAWWCGI